MSGCSWKSDLRVRYFCKYQLAFAQVQTWSPSLRWTLRPRRGLVLGPPGDPQAAGHSRVTRSCEVLLQGKHERKTQGPRPLFFARRLGVATARRCRPSSKLGWPASLQQPVELNAQAQASRRDAGCCSAQLPGLRRAPRARARRSGVNAKLWPSSCRRRLCLYLGLPRPLAFALAFASAAAAARVPGP